jgi:GGDEF domain-containing protein
MFLLLFSKILLFVERFLALKTLDFRRITLFDRDEKVVSIEHFSQILKTELTGAEKAKQNFNVVICNVEGMLRNHSHLHAKDIKKEIDGIFQLVKTGLRDGDFVSYIGGEQFAVFMVNPTGSLPTQISRIDELFSKKFNLKERKLKLRVTDVIHAHEIQKLRRVVGTID